MKFNKSLNIQGKEISSNSKTFIIAEAGVNHGGNIDVAKTMIKMAADAGADAVKFQAFRTDELILDNVLKAPYQKETTGNPSESQKSMLKKLELSIEEYIELKESCKENKIIFLITPFDELSLEELESIDVPAYKIASTDITNIAFIERVAKTGKPIFLSTGMATIDEVRQSLEHIHPINQQLVLLQCTANYPLAHSEVNLSVLESYKNNFDVLLGFSDHSLGTGAAPFAIPMGAKVLEKHYTIDKSLEGPDHQASLDPKELKDFVRQIRKVEEYMGSITKELTVSELETRKSLQKCLVAKKDIKSGEEFTNENIIAKRTGGIGIPANKVYSIYGKIASSDFNTNSIIELD